MKKDKNLLSGMVSNMDGYFSVNLFLKCNLEKQFRLVLALNKNFNLEFFSYKLDQINRGDKSHNKCKFIDR